MRNDCNSGILPLVHKLCLGKGTYEAPLRICLKEKRPYGIIPNL